MKEDDAYRWFVRARWHDNGGASYCPECGNLDVLSIRRRRYRCTARECRREFSATSGTILANRKLRFRTLVLTIALSVHSVKGKAAAQHKRVAAARQKVKLDDVVEMDSMYVGGHVRPANRAEDRVDPPPGREPDRQADGGHRHAGARARCPDAGPAAPDERGDVAWHLVRNHVREGAGLRADQHKAYDELVGLATMVRNDHGRAYVETEDASTNQVESFLSPARRAEIGIHHHMAGKYLVDWYAADLAWRSEDFRRTDFRNLAKGLLLRALGTPTSRNMAGYWQRPGKRRQPLVGWNPLSGMRAARAG